MHWRSPLLAADGRPASTASTAVSDSGPRRRVRAITAPTDLVEGDESPEISETACSSPFRSGRDLLSVNLA